MGIFIRSAIETFGSPRNIIDSAKRVDVEDVEVGWTVEEERESSENDLAEYMGVSEEKQVEGYWNYIDED